MVRWSYCEDDLSKHENTHDNAVIHYDNSNHDDPVNHDDSAKHDNQYYHPKASEFMWKMHVFINEWKFKNSYKKYQNDKNGESKNFKKCLIMLQRG